MLEIWQVENSLKSLDEFGCKIVYEHNQCNHKQNHPNRPRDARCQHLTPVFDVEFGTSRKFGLVLRFDALLPVPPGAVAIEVGTNVRRADYRHKAEYSTNFLIFALFRRYRAREIFPTSPAKTFLERKPSMRIIQVEIEMRNKHNIGGGAGCLTK